jgi:hypothetical protein
MTLKNIIDYMAVVIRAFWFSYVEIAIAGACVKFVCADLSTVQSSCLVIGSSVTKPPLR